MKNEKKITRRKFIKDSAVAAGVSALAVGTPRGWERFPNRLRLAESRCYVLGSHQEQCETRRI